MPNKDKSREIEESIAAYSQSLPEENKTKEIRETIENISPQKKRRKKLLNIFFILFNIAVLVLVFILNSPDAEASSVWDVLKNTNGWYLLLAIACFALVVMAESLIFYYLIWNTTRRRRMRLSVKTALVGRYYDNVTPLGTGGQPFQIYLLNKRDVPGVTATSLPLVKYLMFMVVYCLAGLFVLIFKIDVLSGLPDTQRIVITTTAWVGLAFNLLIPIFVLLCSVIRPLGNAIIILGLKVGRVLRLVKNYGKAYLKAQKSLTDYQKSIKCLTTSFWPLFIVLFLNVIAYTLAAIAPYFILLAFSGGSFVFADMFNTACMTVICLIASSFIPTPGASGAAEVSFGLVFSSIVSGGVLSVALLSWRFISFYSFIFIGIGIIIYDQIRARKQTQKENKEEKRALEDNTDIVGE